MSTTEQKLALLLQNKSKIKTAIEEKGITVGVDTPLSEYGTLIRKIGTTPTTSDIQDILMTADLIKDLGIRPYIEHIYTTEEIQELEDLVNLIVEGE